MAYRIARNGHRRRNRAAFRGDRIGRVRPHRRRVGRKYIYGFEVLVLGASAIASAFSPNIWWLVAFRFILGLGIGGDYPVSATIASEFAGKKTRGLMISSVFAMQGIGLIVGPL